MSVADVVDAPGEATSPSAVADIAARWNERYRAMPADCVPAPAWVLEANAHLLPASGVALDLACGLGSNALWLARRGFTVHAWDLSTVAIDRLNARAAATGLDVSAEVRDAAGIADVTRAFDVIVVSHFLERGLLPHFAHALRPGGLLFYQTYTTERPAGMPGPSNPDFLLRPGELLRSFVGWRVLFYREDGTQGDLDSGMRGLACLVAGVEAP